MKKLILSFLIVSLVALLIVGCSEDMITSNPEAVEETPASTSLERRAGPTIVEIALSDEDFSILVEAVVFAGLVDVLNGNRQFTVFAPINDAFVTLLGDLGLTKEQLFSPGNEGLVRTILLYHVSPGRKYAKKVISSKRVNMLTREFAFVKLNGGAMIGNDTYGYANILATDIKASNGVVHVIDKVLLPPSLEL